MQEPNPIQSMEKISRIYSERREREIAVRICYDVTADNGCKLVQLNNIEVLEP
jgi:hypothetical protein